MWVWVAFRISGEVAFRISGEAAFRISGEVVFRINGEMMKGYRQRNEKIRYAYKNIQNIEYRGMAWPCPETLKESLS